MDLSHLWVVGNQFVPFRTAVYPITLGEVFSLIVLKLFATVNGQRKSSSNVWFRVENSLLLSGFCHPNARTHTHSRNSVCHIMKTHITAAHSQLVTKVIHSQVLAFDFCPVTQGDEPTRDVRISHWANWHIQKTQRDFVIHAFFGHGVSSRGIRRIQL